MVVNRYSVYTNMNMTDSSVTEVEFQFADSHSDAKAEYERQVALYDTELFTTYMWDSVWEQMVHCNIP